MIVNENRAGKALTYLLNTDQGAAKAKQYAQLLEDQKKTILAMEFQKSNGSAAERQKTAEASKAYADHLNKLSDAIYDWEMVRNKRISESLVIEIWRSENANRRKGNI